MKDLSSLTPGSAEYWEYLMSPEYLKALPYEQFLNTFYWSRVREVVLRRDGHECVDCKRNYWLEVHHNTYENRGDELNHLDDLETLCSVCHSMRHGQDIRHGKRGEGGMQHISEIMRDIMIELEYNHSRQISKEGAA